MLLDFWMIELMIKVSEECFGRPDRQTTAEEVMVRSPDSASRCERQRNSRHVVWVARDAPPRLTDVLGIGLFSEQRKFLRD